MPISDLIPSNLSDWKKSFWDDSWDNTQRIGQYYEGNAYGGLARGGDYQHILSGRGVFTARIDLAPTTGYFWVGFRCAVAVP